MNTRELWLRQMAASVELRTWAAQASTELFAGTTRVQTRNTTYLFRNGSCFAVTHRDPARGPSAELIGMRLVGWLIDDPKAPRLKRAWMQGAFAVLFGPGGAGKRPVALTSPTVCFTHYGSSPALSSSVEDGSEQPLFPRRPDQTYTRIGVPGPASSGGPPAA